MPVLGMDHVNIRTPEVAATLGFFRDVLRMTVVPRPGFTSLETAGWVLDDKNFPIVHVGHIEAPYAGDGGAAFVAKQGSGAVHHVALNCAAYAEMRDRLAALDLAFVENAIPQIDLRQIFVREPNGILLELNFRGE